MSSYRFVSAATVSSMVLVSASAAAQEAAADGEGEALEEIVVKGKVSRLPAALETFPGSVTRIGLEDIEALDDFSNDPAQLLNFLVPGMGTAAPASASNFEQTLRGRKATILIDGVPISTPLRDGRHDVRSLSVSTLDSVEIIRGASALYGNGGAGGVINYITRRPTEEGVEFLSEVGTDLSLTHPGDSFAPFVHQAVSGRTGNVDFILDGHYQSTNSAFDSDGDRIRPSPQGQGGTADSDIFNLFGKVGYEFDDHRFEASALYYDQEQDTAFNVIIPGDGPNGVKTQVARGPADPGAANPSNTNLVLNLVYSNEDVLGSAVRTQLFYQELENVFDFFPTFFPGGGQSIVESDKWGARLDITTPVDFGWIIEGGTLLWGADFLNDETGQPLVDGRIWAPVVDQTSVAGFAQARLPIGDRLTISGGVRHEEIDVEFPGFTALFSGEEVAAGETDYSATTFNGGASFKILEPLVIFASFSEGFSVAEVGRILRQAGEMTDFSVAELEASEVENYEAGLRWSQSGYSASVAAFRTESNLGTSITNDLRIARQKEETFGVEASFNAAPSDDWRFGGSVSWIDGNRDADGDGALDRPLASNVVPPVKLTGFIEHDFGRIFSTRLQALRSGERDPFDEVTAFGEVPIESYTLVDASLRADLSAYGTVTLAVNNLFNEDYFPLASQLFQGTNDRFTEGPGTSMRISYAIRY